MKLKNILKFAGAFGVGYGIGYLWKTARTITEQDVKNLEEETNDDIFDEEIAKDFDSQDQNAQQTQNGDAFGEMMKMMGQMMTNNCQNQEAPDNCNGHVDPAITPVNGNEVEGTLKAEGELQTLGERNGNARIYTEKLFSTRNTVEVKDADKCCDDVEPSDSDCHCCNDCDHE